MLLMRSGVCSAAIMAGFLLSERPWVHYYAHELSSGFQDWARSREWVLDCCVCARGIER